MTALTVAVRPAEDANLRPLRWRRMIWITWRHHRVALGGVVAFLGALSAWLWIAGLQVRHAYAAAAACHPAGSPACMALILNFHLTSGVLKTGFPLQPAPALIGAFIGAPLLAREIETGTFRYAWTQGFGRWRWTLAKLVSVGVATAAIAGAFSLLLFWYYQPYFDTSSGTQLSSASPLSPGLFDLRGVAFAAWTLAAFAIGALAGMLTRRVVPAIVTTLASYTILAVLAGIVIGHTTWARHQQASHFWPLQWIEGGCLFALSTLLVTITVLLVHRRAV
jgi:ABC-2 family transporter